MMRQQVVGALRGRVRRFDATGDGGAVLEPAATAEAQALMQSAEAGGPPLDIEAHAVLGWFFWSRHQAAPTGTGRAKVTDYEIAVLHFAQVAPDDPARPVPAAIRAVLAGTDPLPPGTPTSALWAAGASWLLRRAEVTGDLGALDRAVGLLRRAADADAEDRPGRLSELGNALATRFDLTGAAADLDDAVEAHRAAVEDCPEGADGLGGYLNNLSISLRQRYEHRGTVDDLRAAVVAGERAVALVERLDPRRPGRLSSLASARHAAFRQHGRVEDLERAIDCLLEATFFATDDPGLPGYWNNLASARITRFNHAGDMEDLNTGILAARRAVQATPEWHADRLQYLSNLGVHLTLRFAFTRAEDDLRDAIAAGRAAVAATPAGHAARAGRLSNLGTTLLDSFSHTARLADLDAAIAQFEAATRAAVPGDPGLAGFRSNLSAALGRRAEQVDDAPGLDRAVDTGRSALAAHPPDDPARPGSVVNLAGSLIARYRRQDTLGDLDEAVALLRAGPWTARRPEVLRLAGLCTALRHRYLVNGRVEDLDEAIAAGRAAVDATSCGLDNTAGFATNFGGALLARYDLAGHRPDLVEAVVWQRRAVAATAAGHPDRPLYLGNLASSLARLCEATGSVADALEAVTAARAALHETPPGHPQLPVRLATLGAALLSRAARLSEPGTLDEATERLREAQRGATDRAARVVCLINLGNALMLRHERTGSGPDGDAAVGYLRGAAALLSDNRTAQAAVWSNLGNALRVLHRTTGSQAHIDEAIAVLQVAVECAAPADPNRAPYLSNLGAAELSRARPADVDAAVASLDQARGGIPAGHPAEAVCVLNLGLALRERYGRGGGRPDGDGAVRAFQDAVAATTGPVLHRMTAAIWLGSFATDLGDAATAADGMAAAVGLLPSIAWHGLIRADRERWLTDWSGLATGAAALAVAAGREEQAVVVLDQGCAVLWTQILNTRSDVTALAAVRPDQAARLQEIRTELEGTSITVLPEPAVS
ncbi:hypothetical protein [Dactylosporangium sp. NPDC051541]|uniref:hypothetical protein n=1 Tax=Dactylosporangium sp. NPDC051541 TaxID=3363977 RepID=UPI003788CF0E